MSIINPLEFRKLNTLICKYCNERVTGDKDFKGFHIYIAHRDKLRECFDEGFPFIKNTRPKDKVWNELLDIMQNIEKRELELV